MSCYFWLLLASASSLHLTLADCQFAIYDGLHCNGLTDSDLPLQGFAGHYSRLILGANNFSRLGAGSFPGVITDTLVMNGNYDLTVIESDFLEAPQLVMDFQCDGNRNLKQFPFEFMEKFTSLQHLSLIASGVESIPASISWPESLIAVEMKWNAKLKVINQFAFSSATKLLTLDLSESGDFDIVIKSNGFHTMSNSPGKSLIWSPYHGPVEPVPVLEANAFGNVDGGKLWNKITIETLDFPPEVYRLLLKSHFDKGDTELFGNDLEIKVTNCDSCDISWLYKDAQMFGLQKYRGLIGAGNAACPGIGPVLETENEEFISLMESCPYTPMPWPPPNHCENVSDPNQDIVADPNDCQCFYLCSGQAIHGHECCSPPLVFNPEALVCDFEFNVPSCQLNA